jgi:hypothetical protein
MKLKNLIPERYRTRLIRQFGTARLIRRANGGHELIGGTQADRNAATEWVALFAHEVVFIPSPLTAGGGGGPRKIWFTDRLQPSAY